MPDKAVEFSAEETTAAEIIERLDDGERITLEIEKLGITTDVTLRKQSDTYYCDTPIKLLTYDDREGLETCLQRLGVPEA